LSLSGIYTRIENKVTFAILTKEASLLFAKIHNKKNRQPVILYLDQKEDLLSGDLDQKEIEKITEKDYDLAQLKSCPVSNDFFHPKINSDVEPILNRVEYEEYEVGFNYSNSKSL
jgi:putative SOS response-associated peptidase YedK